MEAERKMRFNRGGDMDFVSVQNGLKQWKGLQQVYFSSKKK